MELVKGALCLLFVLICGGLLGYGISKGNKRVENQSDEEEIKYLTECEITPFPSRFYISAIGLKAKGARSYVSFISERLTGDCPTEAELSAIKNTIMMNNPDFKDCVILSFQRLAN